MTETYARPPGELQYVSSIRGWFPRLRFFCVVSRPVSGVAMQAGCFVYGNLGHLHSSQVRRRKLVANFMVNIVFVCCCSVPRNGMCETMGMYSRKAEFAENASHSSPTFTRTKRNMFCFYFVKIAPTNCMIAHQSSKRWFHLTVIPYDTAVPACRCVGTRRASNVPPALEEAASRKKVVASDIPVK